MTSNSLPKPSQHNLSRRLIVRFLNKLYKKLPSKELPKSIDSIIIFAQEKLGDAILLLPFLKALNETFPGIAIDLCCTSYNRKIFEGIPFLRNCVSYRPYNLRLLKLIRSERYDVLYNPKSGPSSTFHYLTNKINAKIKICLNDDYNNPIYNVHLPNDNKKHIAEKYCELLFCYGLKSPVENWLPEYFYQFPSTIQERDYVAINISAGHSKRKYPYEKWRKVISHILHVSSMEVALFCSKKEIKDAQRLKSIFQDKVHYPLNSPDLYHASGIINESAFLISLDTSLIHLAAALQKPIIGLYSNDLLNYTRYKPYNVLSKNIKSNTDLIRDIDPNDIIEYYDQMIDKIDKAST
tara:strand:- start:2356 stop:3411 length:1056 start_codon:yes stop_codon:yes gene_type:complete